MDVSCVPAVRMTIWQHLFLTAGNTGGDTFTLSLMPWHMAQTYGACVCVCAQYMYLAIVWGQICPKKWIWQNLPLGTYGDVFNWKKLCYINHIFTCSLGLRFAFSNYNLLYAEILRNLWCSYENGFRLPSTKLPKSQRPIRHSGFLRIIQWRSSSPVYFRRLTPWHELWTSLILIAFKRPHDHKHLFSSRVACHCGGSMTLTK